MNSIHETLYTFTIVFEHRLTSNKYQKYSFSLFSPESYFHLGLYDLKCLHKREQYGHKNGNRDEIIGRDYDSQLSGPKQGPVDVLQQEKSFQSSAAEAPTNVQQDI